LFAHGTLRTQIVRNEEQQANQQHNKNMSVVGFQRNANLLLFERNNAILTMTLHINGRNSFPKVGATIW
jgi:hypothetical protein